MIIMSLFVFVEHLLNVYSNRLAINCTSEKSSVTKDVQKNKHINVCTSVVRFWSMMAVHLQWTEWLNIGLQQDR